MQVGNSPHVLIVEPPSDQPSQLSSILADASIDVRLIPKPPSFTNGQSEKLIEIAMAYRPALIIFAFNDEGPPSADQF
jgi:hypothetical protein